MTDTPKSAMVGKGPIAPEFDLDSIMKKDLNLLSMDELKLRLAEVERRGTAKVELPKAEDLSKLEPDDLVMIHMVDGPMGDIFKINEFPYPAGPHKVKLRVARQLASMVSDAWKIERERTISRSNAMNGALLRGEELAKIERFESIMKEN